ncbi:MAG: NUDIX domain-containing protein [Kiritimatiellaeota bacterium]|nr:NUDIX domain-containing protein [Kiritimatiellota bacterium]
MTEELFDIVDEQGRVLGRRPRRECHSHPALIHQAVHVLVFNRRGDLFLQLRGLQKDLQPGKWDTSVGGHMQPGETPEHAALREAAEELGLRDPTLHFAYQYLWRSPRETELVRTFAALSEGPFQLQASEIAEGRFWSLEEIRARLDAGGFTPNFEFEFSKFSAEARPLLERLLLTFP